MRDLMKYAIECMTELDKLEIEYGTVVEWKINTRAKQRWGLCRHTPNEHIIEINKILLDENNDEQGLKDTIIHELLHTCKGCNNHGTKWKQLAETVNRTYGYNIQRTSTAEEKGVVNDTYKYHPMATKYLVKCNHCHQTVAKRTRRCGVVEHPENYWCGNCGGSLYIEEV